MRGRKMSHATIKLLQAAVEILGSEEALARHFDIGTILMQAYLEGRRPLPDYLLLRAVDVVLDQVKPGSVVPPAVDQPSSARLPTSSG